jgi:hypothetical protein
LPFTAHKAPHFIHLGVLDLSDDDVKLCRIKAFQEAFVDLYDRGLFFFQHINDRRRTDPEDADDIPHPTAIERHVDDLLFDRGQAPFVSIL